MKKLTSAMLIAFAANAASNSALADPVGGTSSGTWVDPIPPSAIVGGVGTSTFTWGSIFSGILDNTLRFTGPSFIGEIGVPFKVGSLFYQNGTTDVAGLANQIDLRLALNFTTPSLGPINGDFVFQLESTPNVSWDPDRNADFVRLPSTGSTKQFEVGGLKYELALSNFRKVVGDGFLTSTGSVFHVREQKSATADLYATLLVTGQTEPIPEPSTYAMMLAGLGALGLMVARRRRTLS